MASEVKTCDTDPSKSPLLTEMTLHIASETLQISLLFYAIIKRRQQTANSSKTINRLCMATIILGLVMSATVAIFQIILPLFRYAPSSIMCGLLVSGFIGTCAIAYYFILITFWGWRVYRVFQDTVWGVTHRFIRVWASLSLSLSFFLFLMRVESHILKYVPHSFVHFTPDKCESQMRCLDTCVLRSSLAAALAHSIRTPTDFFN